SKYDLNSSLPTFYLNNLNIGNNNKLQNKYFNVVYEKNFLKNEVIYKKSLINYFILPHPVLISKVKKLDKVIAKIEKKINHKNINSLVFKNKNVLSKYKFFINKKKKFRRDKILKKLISKIKINKLLKKKIYIKYLNNYKFIIMK